MKQTIKFRLKLYRLVLYLMFLALLQTRNSEKKKLQSRLNLQHITIS